MEGTNDTTTAPTTATTVRDDPVLTGAADVMALAILLRDRGVVVKAISWEGLGYQPSGIRVWIAGGEAAVDALADEFDLKPEDRSNGNYDRVGTFRSGQIEVWSGRTRPVCGCGAVCTHRAAS